MLRVFSPYGPTAGSARVRVFQWLARTGAIAAVDDFMSAGDNRPRGLVRRPFRAIAAHSRLRGTSIQQDDTVLVHREASPLSGGRLEVRLLHEASRGVFDLDDGMFLAGPRGLTRNTSKKTVLAIRAADVVVAGSESIADAVSQWTSRVMYIPSCIEPSDYCIKSQYDIGESPVIGWMGSASSEAALVPLAPTFERLAKVSGARLRLVGAQSGPMDDLGAGWLDRVPWTPVTWGRELSQFDVGIMPLLRTRSDRYKCGYKLLQYAASGVPALAEDFGENRLIADRLSMSPVGESTWYERILDLVHRSPGTRKREASTARSAAIRLYSYAAWESVWRQAVGID